MQADQLDLNQRQFRMKARDVMVSPVITVKLSSSVSEVADVFLEGRISAAPVVDDQGQLVGIVTEGDLLHRAEAEPNDIVLGGCNYLPPRKRSPPNTSRPMPAKWRML